MLLSGKAHLFGTTKHDSCYNCLQDGSVYSCFVCPVVNSCISSQVLIASSFILVVSCALYFVLVFSYGFILYLLFSPPVFSLPNYLMRLFKFSICLCGYCVSGFLCLFLMVSLISVFFLLID